MPLMTLKTFERYAGSAFLGPKAMRQLQQKLLRRHLTYCGTRSPFYRRLFRRRRIDPARITLGTLKDIPCTDKRILTRHNRSCIAVSPEQTADIVFSSGTTGEPAQIVYSRRDLERLAYNERQSFVSCGITARDRVLLTCTMDRCFIAGLAYYLGTQAVGASSIRNGLNSLYSHASVIRQVKPTVIIGVPSFLRKLGGFLCRENIPVSSVRRLVCIGEPLRDRQLQPLALTRDLERLWSAKAYSTYSSSEIISTFCECLRQKGGHLHPELAVVEIVNDAGTPLKPGAAGEIVVTPLGVTGMPLVRFRTGDIGVLDDTPCGCGRRSPRLGPVLGRKEQMLKVKGTTVYPQAIYSALDEMPEVSDYFVTVASQGALSDRITVTVSLRKACPLGRIEELLASRLRVTPEVVAAPEETVRAAVYNPAMRKPVRFHDRRKK
ncbi:MAG: AMP-binding protein [Candidatus Omnitrophica bacterium]|nr:AMP-binding protein [Candidatus Omnitrophota bacterium]